MKWLELSPKARAVVLLASGGVLALGAGLGFLELAEDMADGDTDRFDERIIVWLTAHRSPALTSLFRSITALGSWAVITILTLGICGALLLAGERRFALMLGLTMAGTPVLSRGLKAIYGRERPSVVHLETVASSSFPSGHTIASTAFFVTVALLVSSHTPQRALRSFLVGYALLVAALVALSRVYLGVHYPSDVAGGALLGVAWSLTCVIADRLLRKQASRA